MCSKLKIRNCYLSFNHLKRKLLKISYMVSNLFIGCFVFLFLEIEALEDVITEENLPPEVNYAQTKLEHLLEPSSAVPQGYIYIRFALILPYLLDTKLLNLRPIQFLLYPCSRKSKKNCPFFFLFSNSSHNLGIFDFNHFLISCLIN